MDDAARVMGSANGVSTGRVERAPGSTSEIGVDWVLPTNLGALPAQLKERAQDVLVNQRKIVGELEKAKRVTLQHLAAVRSVPPARNPGASVYLDVAG
ncbi:hypothetical protein E3T55_15485 [Cryobacterium frigoriphilum]|uniref:Uncharacterized protein n=1 Tax=Cryobacterium frigoriphilum TaxID=1259150 RepID=A0A4V3IQL0_9MICO|nr:hypothetical protein [Cryobacterium frigoriphilum]TFD47269.1 hypothetical protein E3T55_15485 [Cryobacterium frigoriphilum]